MARLANTILALQGEVVEEKSLSIKDIFCEESSVFENFSKSENNGFNEKTNENNYDAFGFGSFFVGDFFRESLKNITDIGKNYTD